MKAEMGVVVGVGVGVCLGSAPCQAWSPSCVRRGEGGGGGEDGGFGESLSELCRSKGLDVLLVLGLSVPTPGMGGGGGKGEGEGEGGKQKIRRQIAVYQPRIPPGVGEGGEGGGGGGGGGGGEGEQQQLTITDLGESIASFLEAQEAFECEHVECQGFDGAVFEQRNTKASRKQILPAVVDFIASM